MYIPKYFEEKDKEHIRQLIKEFGFAILVSMQNGSLIAVHIPLALSENEQGDWMLFGHVSKGNVIWKTIQNGQEIMAIFSGPHAYVSPSWYNHKNVPTWNYLAAHLYGKAKILEGESAKTALRALMSRYEHQHAEHPMAFEDVPTDILKADLAGLVAFEIKVDRIEAASKLSQNRDAESYQSIVDHLKDSDAYDAKRIAEEMEKRKK